MRLQTDQATADEPGRRTLDRVLALAEVAVHRADAVGFDGLPETFDDALVVLVLLGSDRLEHLAGGVGLLIVGPRTERLAGEVLGEGGGPEDGLLLQARVGERDEEFVGAEAVELCLFRRFDGLTEGGCVHVGKSTAAGFNLGLSVIRPVSVFKGKTPVPSCMSVHPESDESVPSVSPADLHELVAAGEPLTILDVRNRDEFEAWHVDGPAVTARQVPHVKFIQAEVTGTAADLVEDLPEPIVVVCGEGEASAHAAGLLTDLGIDARNLAGGMDAWADLLVARELADVPGTVVQYDRPSSGCLSYLVVSGDEAAVIDPLRAFADRYVADASEYGADIKYAIDTHVHADHVSGIRAVAELSDAQPVMPELARERGLSFDARPLADGETLDLGKERLTAVATPGHTSEMTAIEYDGLLFTGDGLFLESVARPDLEDGDEGAPEAARELYHSLQETVLPYPDSVRIAPAHYSEAAEQADDGTYTATVGDLERRLDALRMREDDFVEYVLADMPPRPNNYERIIETNLGRETLDDEEAFEIELGPNNCAATR